MSMLGLCRLLYLVFVLIPIFLVFFPGFVSDSQLLLFQSFELFSLSNKNYMKFVDFPRILRSGLIEVRRNNIFDGS